MGLYIIADGGTEIGNVRIESVRRIVEGQRRLCLNGEEMSFTWGWTTLKGYRPTGSDAANCGSW